jgi:hypothetical protein
MYCCVVRVRLEIMGSQNCRIVGKSQSVLMMFNHMIFTRTRMCACCADDDIRGDDPGPWEGVAGGVSLMHVLPWTRVHPDCRAADNRRLTVLLPLVADEGPGKPKPTLTLDGVTRYFVRVSRKHKSARAQPTAALALN